MQEAMRKVSSQLDMEDAKYRSVYLPVVRDHEPRSLDVFDFADSSSVTGTRESSNTANQALFMLNNPFVIQQSEALAKRLLNRDADGSRGYSENQNSPFWRTHLIHTRIEPQLFHQTCTGAFGLGECLGPNDFSGSLIRYAQYDPAAAFIGDSRAIFEELIKRIALSGFLELQSLTFEVGHETMDLFQ